MTKKNILIVDDEPNIINSIRHTLYKMRDECCLFSAHNGAEALKLIKDTPIDVIITDILMPEMDGLETILAVRKNYPVIKIIAMTGGGDKGGLDFLREAKIFGASYTLKKPFPPDELLKALQDALESQSSNHNFNKKRNRERQ